MIEQIQGILSKSIEVVMSSGSAAKTFAIAHPAGVGIVLGITTYSVINKYWFNSKEEAKETESAKVAPA